MKSTVKSLLYSILAIAIITTMIFVIYKSQKNDEISPIKKNEPKVNISCDSSLWEHVYNTFRLKVVEQCKSVTGYVELLRKENDGNINILLRLDSNESKLLNNDNYAKQKGCLLLIPVCAVNVTNEEAVENCKDFVNQVLIPSKHQHIRATGSYVMDVQNGWMEIHPVTKIEVIE